VAGDSMVAEWCWVLPQGKSWSEMAKVWGLLCGTAATMSPPGTQLW